MSFGDIIDAITGWSATSWVVAILFVVIMVYAALMVAKALDR